MAWYVWVLIVYLAGTVFTYARAARSIFTTTHLLPANINRAKFYLLALLDSLNWPYVIVREGVLGYWKEYN